MGALHALGQDIKRHYRIAPKLSKYERISDIAAAALGVHRPRFRALGQVVDIYSLARTADPVNELVVDIGP